MPASVCVFTRTRVYTHTHTHTHSLARALSLFPSFSLSLSLSHNQNLLPSHTNAQVDRVMEERAKRPPLATADKLWHDFGAGELVVVHGLTKVFVCV